MKKFSCFKCKAETFVFADEMASFLENQFDTEEYDDCLLGELHHWIVVPAKAQVSNATSHFTSPHRHFDTLGDRQKFVATESKRAEEDADAKAFHEGVKNN